MILAILLAAQAHTIAVLEFRDKVPEEERLDPAYLSDQVRTAVKDELPEARVITRENMLVLLQASGKDLAACEGECEVDTGRRIGADLVVSGELLKFGSSYKVDLKLHATADGRLLSGAIASGKSIDELDAGIGAAVGELLAPLRQPQAPAQQPAPAGPRPSAPAPQKAPPLIHGLVTRREHRTNLEFVRVLDGSAHIGCAAGDSRCRPDEKPPRELGVGGFWIGRTEVTTGAFAACAKARGCNRNVEKRDVAETGVCNWRNKRWNHPINCVSWEEAGAFCRWIGGRLPTSIEWEYAARAGDEVIYPWGNDPPTGARANFCDVNCPRALKDPAAARGRADLAQDDGFAATAPVGSFPAGANKWGLLDMAGNVAEWTASSSGDERELRGGNWSMPAVNLRASHRGHTAQTRNDPSIGFRCAQ